MIRRILLLFTVLSLLLINGCKKDMYTNEIASEDRYFDLYMKTHYPDIVPSADGLYFIDYEEGTGASPDTTEYVLLNFLLYTVPDEVVVDTYTEGWARDYNLYLSGVLYGPFKLKLATAIKGLQEGLTQMKEGGIARLIFKSDLGYAETGFGNIDPFVSLMYDIELLEVIPDVYAREQQQIEDYLAEQDAYETFYDKETDASYYYIPDEVGDSVQVKNKDNVEIFYTGQLLDGREFDSNEGNSSGLKVQVGKKEVIRGWDLGLLKFRYGGKGRLLIPHELAYGEAGTKAKGSTKTSIPPVEALLFDIEVLKTSN